MRNIDKYNEAFSKVFNVPASAFETLEYKQTEGWNSMAQIALVAQLEEAFGLDFDMDDIYDLKSYKAGKKLLAEKFGINVDE